MREVPANPGFGPAEDDGERSALELWVPPVTGVPAPSPTTTFEGLNKNSWGSDWPPNASIDVGPNHIIETVNTSVGIFNKVGELQTAFTFDTLMSQGSFGNQCDTDNAGDPIVVYDTFDDRWVVSDLAYTMDGSNNVDPQVVLECFAVSKTGDPVTGGWWFYSINTTGGRGDAPKIGVWPDGLYLSFNMYGYLAAGGFQNVRLYAMNKAQMYLGAPTVQVVSFDLPSTENSLMPANARLQTGTPPAGSPGYFTSVFNFLNQMSVWKFQVDWAHIGLSTLTGPINSTTTSFTPFTGGTVPTPGSSLDTRYPRLMMQNQYSNIGGVESLWNSHTAGTLGSGTTASVRFYQTKVTGGTVEASSTQSGTWSPALVPTPTPQPHYFMPSVAVNKNGDMAIGYNVASSALNPAIRYAGRFAGDAPNSLSLTETSLVEGTGTQSGRSEWGEYATMTLDPDGCTFWLIGEYYQATGLNWNTRVGSFRFTPCTNETTGTVSGTVKNASNAPLANATVRLGGRTSTTDAAGAYSFIVPDGTYPRVTAVIQGYNAQSFTNIVVPGGGAVVQNFSLTKSATSGCFTDTTQDDFQTDVAAINCDVTASPGNVTLANPASIDQQNTTVTSGSFPFGATVDTWSGQTFTAGVTGQLTRADVYLWCSGCSGTSQPITVAIRAVNGATGAPDTLAPDLATTTIAGFNSSVKTYYQATFGTPAVITAGSKYAVILRLATTRTTGGYAWMASVDDTVLPNSNPYPAGARISSANGGGSWAVNNTAGGIDHGFKVWVQGYQGPGTFTSSLKDANPAPGSGVRWGNISWNASVPAGTTLQFRVAGSNNPNGPFSFVGPDGTAGTSFSNAASLAQFNGLRYLRYQAAMTTTENITPAINDVTICFSAPPRPLMDLNADGAGDVFTYSQSSGAWKRATANGSGAFVEANGSWDPGWTVTPARFNNDNYTDMFLFNTTSGQWFRMLNDGANGWTTQTFGTWWPGWQRYVMDLNGDEISDVFLYDPASGVWFKSVLSNPAGDFTYSQGGWSPDWEITLMTLNGDAYGDMFLMNRTTGRWFWALGQAGAAFTYPATDVWFAGWAFYPGDFNGDGLSDLLLHHDATGNYFVAMNNGAGTGFTYTSGGWSLGWTPYVGDLDADGDQDLLLHAANTGQWFEMISNGVGGFSAAGSAAWSLGWNIYPADLNGDGRIDFVLYHPTTGVWYQARNLTLGTFSYTSGHWSANLTVLVRSPFM